MKSNRPETGSSGASPRVAEPLSAPSEREAVPLPEVGAHRSKPSRLWLWFVAAFLIQGAAWTAWFVLAAKHRVQEVPLEGAVSNKR